MQVLIIDNYDSFVYNIVQMTRGIEGVSVEVMRNDDPRLNALEEYDAIIISPGPDVPEAAGRLMEVIHRYHTTKPMLGICLGFQALAQFFGAKLTNLTQPLHGHESPLTHVDYDDALYRSLPRPITVGHYHSWIIDPATLPEALHATATDDMDNLMSFTHRDLHLYGVQYHPESIITTSGSAIIANFIAAARGINR